MNRTIWIVLILVSIGACLGVLYAYQRVVREMTIGEVDLSQVPDGSYAGSASAVLVSAEVRVTVADHKIHADRPPAPRTRSGAGLPRSLLIGYKRPNPCRWTSSPALPPAAR